MYLKAVCRVTVFSLLTAQILLLASGILSGNRPLAQRTSSTPFWAHIITSLILLAGFAALFLNRTILLRIVGAVFLICGALPLVLIVFSMFLSTHDDGDLDVKNDIIKPMIFLTSWIYIGLALWWFRRSRMVPFLIVFVKSNREWHHISSCRRTWDAATHTFCG
jgi:hypothetical protein